MIAYTIVFRVVQLMKVWSGNETFHC